MFFIALFVTVVVLLLRRHSNDDAADFPGEMQRVDATCWVDRSTFEQTGTVQLNFMNSTEKEIRFESIYLSSIHLSQDVVVISDGRKLDKISLYVNLGMQTGKFIVIRVGETIVVNMNLVYHFGLKKDSVFDVEIDYFLFDENKPKRIVTFNSKPKVAQSDP